MEEVRIYRGDTYTLKGTFYPSTNTCPRILVYFHGGGLIFGQRDDLPNTYIEVITQYYNLLTVDYRLLPEATFTDIVDDLQHIHDYVSAQFAEVYCMGRSAGGFLSMLYATKYDVQGLIDFYGFYDVQHPAFKSIPNNHRNVMAMLTDDIKTLFTLPDVSTDLPPNPRYLLYLYYRHHGLWPVLIDYEIDTAALTKLPKLFIAHASNDPDVPITYSKKLANLHKQATFVEIDSNSHAFDNSVTPDMIQLYHQACQYIQNKEAL
ncbi:alpha/beta hydrolase [Staphylococcus americanisciuri]|uniref:Alpha/beta hydrolase n=1 Tax=Staphylococcus americanisciuri TaxID=2973940 RepID=A0ABT2F0L1_9STAP|nr:alpha/beta hydrolase [Staphylococcus americanisciuri]MCS4485909.1 alpha/beta hydrolase [Staphylococcus americanisciuri]